MGKDVAEPEPMAPRGLGNSEDAALLQLFSTQGDRQALGLLFTRHADAAYRFALRLSGRPADAEDAVQTAFLQVFHHPGTFKGESAVKSWILGFVLNACRRKVREEGRRKVRQDRAAERSDSVAEAPVDPETRERVQQAVQDLPELYRAPLWLHYAEGLSPGEVAAALQLPEGTVRKQISRGVDRLRERLAPAGAALSLAAILPTLAVETAPSTLSASLAGIASGATPAAAAVPAGVAGKFVAVGAAATLIVASATLFWWGELPWQRPPDFAEIDRRVLEWQPSPDERRFDRIGWAPDLVEARRLSKESGRPVVLLTQSGRVNLGRSDGGSNGLRANALRDPRVIDLLNAYFVPVYLSNTDFEDGGSASFDERELLRSIQRSARQVGPPVGMDWLFLLDPVDGRVLDTMDLPNAMPPKRFAGWLEAHRVVPPGEPLVSPASQSRPPTTLSGDLILQVTARYLDAKGEIETVRHTYHEHPAEDWIVLRPEEWKGLLSSGPIDPVLARRILATFHPLDVSVGQHPDERNRYEEASLRVSVLSRSFARIEGRLRMQRSFNQLTKLMDLPIQASVKGYLEFDADQRTVRTLKMIAEDAVYGTDRFGVALRSVP